MPMPKPGDRVDAVYLGNDGQVMIGWNREVVRVERRPDVGVYKVIVDLPDDAADDRQDTYLTDSYGQNDYLIWPTDRASSQPEPREPGGA